MRTRANDSRNEPLLINEAHWRNAHNTESSDIMNEEADVDREQTRDGALASYRFTFEARAV